MLRMSCLSHFLDNCVTPDTTSPTKKSPSLTEFWKVSDDKPGYFFKWPYGNFLDQNLNSTFSSSHQLAT